MMTGTNSEALDFNSVQRGNAEMQRRCQGVIDACTYLGKANPIMSIHDIGAGGLSNGCPELVEATGGKFQLREVHNEEMSMNPMEIWCCEAQERYVLALRPEARFFFEELCRRELGELRRSYPVRGQVYARLSLRSEGAECFGSPAELYTTQLVMGESLNRRAIAVNDLYRRGNPNAPRWHELSDFTRRSNLAAADHLSVKLRLLGESTASKESFARAWERFSASEGAQRERFRRIEHARWMRFHLLNGWRYAPERDNTLRLHPLLLPFDRLSAEDQQKDDYSWEILRFGEDIL
jgi:hypothetical protein